MSKQLALFELAPSAARSRKAAGPKSRLAELRVQLAHAAGDLEDAESNLAEVAAHEHQSAIGGIDDNWIQGGVQFGAVQVEWLTDRTDGRYSIRQLRWLRHLRFQLHLQLSQLRATVHDLTQQVAALAALETGAIPHQKGH